MNNFASRLSDDDQLAWAELYDATGGRFAWGQTRVSGFRAQVQKSTAMVKLETAYEIDELLFPLFRVLMNKRAKWGQVLPTELRS